MSSWSHESPDTSAVWPGRTIVGSMGVHAVRGRKEGACNRERGRGHCLGAMARVGEFAGVCEAEGAAVRGCSTNRK